MIQIKHKTAKYVRRGLCLALALTMLFLASCSSGGKADKADKADKIEVLCTIYPQYDWVKNIVGDTDGVNVSLLVTSGADVHGYQPSVEDMVKIKESDAIVLIGGGEDEWVRTAFEGADGKAIALTELEGIVLRGISDEYIASDHEGHDHEVHYHDYLSSVLDEHLWLSLANARTSCLAICEWLCVADPDNAEAYRANTDRYIASLDALDAEFKSLEGISDKPVIFADRFPFVYLFEDYGISYFAAFEGCSSDSAADFDTVARLAERLKADRSEHIAVSESADEHLAESVMRAAGQECEIVVFDSLQSVTARQIANGYCYIDAMKANFDALSEILK